MRKTDVILYDVAAKMCQFDVTSVCTNIVLSVNSSVLKQRFYIYNIKKKTNWCSMQEKVRIFKSSWYYSRFLIRFSICKKWPILCLRSPVLQSKQVVLTRSAPTLLTTKPDQNMTNLRRTADHHAVPPLNIRPVESGIIPDHFSTGWKTYPAHHDFSERARPIPAVF